MWKTIGPFATPSNCGIVPAETEKRCPACTAIEYIQRRYADEKNLQLPGKPIGYSDPDRFRDGSGFHLQIAE